MKRTSMVWLVLIVAIACVSAFGQEKDTPAVKTVPSVDLKQYAGKWYEIAKYPNEFQKDCVGNTTAEYVLKEKGKIEVINKCLTQKAEEKIAKGDVRVEEKSNNAKLKVRFAPAALSFLPFVWGDYWIIELGDDYEYSVVGDPKREYFWILSRKPEMTDALYQDILRRAETQGFDPGRVQKTSQKVEPLKGAVLDRS